MENRKPLALVTGASAGLGATFARRLAREGYRVILVARRRDRLEALAREIGDAEILDADLIDEAGVKLVEERIRAANLDLLVNNAGFGTAGFFFDAPIEGQNDMHRLHILATMRLTHAALPGMVERGSGAVINVSSVAAYGHSPGNVSYCATKAWMNSFTDGLDLELKRSGSPVKVQALCPGFTITEFHDVMKMDRKLIPNFLWMSAESVVDASLRGLARDKVFVIPGLIYKTVVMAQQCLPRWLTSRIARRYSKALRRDRRHAKG